MPNTYTRNLCVNHSAYLTDRGGHNKVLDLKPLVEVNWGRLRDDISTASVTLASPECLADVSIIEPGRHELVIFRGDERVWEGPVSLVRWEAEHVTVEAKDVMFYVQRLISRSGLSNKYPNVDTVVNRALTLLSTELPRMEALDPPVNVLPYVVGYHHDDDARTSKVTVPYQMTVFDDIDDLAAKSGIDYTVIGRSIIVHDTHVALGQTPTLTDADINGAVIVTAYGNELATFAAVTGKDGAYGWAAVDGVGQDGVHDYYGLWEILDDAYDEEEGTDEPTQSELNSQAKRNLSGRMPTPITVRIPDGSSLAPTSAITMNLMVPGVLVPLVASLTGREFSQMQKLDKVDVTEAAQGEEVKVTLTPASEDAIVPDEALARVRRTHGAEVG